MLVRYSVVWMVGMLGREDINFDVVCVTNGKNMELRCVHRCWRDVNVVETVYVAKKDLKD